MCALFLGDAIPASLSLAMTAGFISIIFLYLVYAYIYFSFIFPCSKNFDVCMCAYMKVIIIAMMIMIIIKNVWSFFFVFLLCGNISYFYVLLVYTACCYVALNSWGISSAKKLREVDELRSTFGVSEARKKREEEKNLHAMRHHRLQHLVFFQTPSFF